ncbi:Peptidoglycan-N-acetylmuramic acid deacetylase PdaC [Andreprevotia sp. IGB-42]|uniref:polysaccharide deacetylase family protein n=1 Tax=Andreprevotia sp. IGB-42 TaxID=2497473 RepID=UPI0013583F60|nr:polysaccharide deacetylase family protein [Andreprevotia sp. IGB-42]KAF0814889.1 Peptidoglycan-N-acetylmuramic acid deacetylase PdaC [Andreprevotia sp. IGB-42]
MSIRKLLSALPLLLLGLHAAVQAADTASAPVAVKASTVAAASSVPAVPADEKPTQKVRTSFLDGWDQVPLQRLEDQAARYRGTYFLEGLHNSKRIALTFDDGPSAYTASLLKVLEKNQVKATFFFLGEHVNTSPELAQAALKAGHTIANHSYNHPYLNKLSNTQLWDEQFGRSQQIFQARLGIKPALIRPPYGVINDEQVTLLRDKGYKLILWSIDTQDWYVARKLGAADGLYKTVLNTVHPEAIILMHDGGGYRADSVEAVSMLIPELKKQGYEFVTVDQLIGTKPYLD